MHQLFSKRPRLQRMMLAIAGAAFKGCWFYWQLPTAKHADQNHLDLKPESSPFNQLLYL